MPSDRLSETPGPENAQTPEISTYARAGNGNPRGGARPNSGPRPTGVLRTNITLDPYRKEKARTLGDGKVSRGIRLAIDLAWSARESAPHAPQSSTRAPGNEDGDTEPPDWEGVGRAP